MCINTNNNRLLLHELCYKIQRGICMLENVNEF